MISTNNNNLNHYLQQQQQSEPTPTTALTPAPPMFACIIPSRPVQTNAIAIPPDKVLFEFDEPNNINHLVVFLTGAVPLPEGWAASVHFLFPTKSEWQLLGMISPVKPSAIFKLKGTVIPSSTMSTVDLTTRASLGLHLAPLAQIEAECAHLNASKSLVPCASSTPTPIQIAKAIGLNLFNYLTSFAIEVPGRAGTWVELGTLEKWWKSFELKCAADPTGDRWLSENVKDT